MIIYFSGTGNSLRVAQSLAHTLQDELYDIESSVPMRPIQHGETLGVIFPVYAWGLPAIVEQFLTMHIVPLIKGETAGERYLWAVMTCGDDMGYTDRVLAKVLGRGVDATFSVQMPNTYVCLPGFDVDPQELAQQKVRTTDERLPHIAQLIREQATVCEVTRGATPWIKTYLLRPFFNKYLVTSKYFKATDACASCGLCAKQCPMHDIAMSEGKPQWCQSTCTGCLRCYHQCPQRAIEWGSFTKQKGQKR